MTTIADYVASARVWADKILGITPFANIPVNLTDIFQQKVYLPDALKQNPKDHYYTYLKNKGVWRSAILLIPVLGAIICWFYDSNQAKKKQEALDAITKNQNFDLFTKLSAELQKEICLEKHALFDNLQLDALKKIFKDLDLFEAASKEIQIQLLKNKHTQKETDALKLWLPRAKEDAQTDFVFNSNDQQFFQHMSEKVQRAEIDKNMELLQYATKEIQEAYFAKDMELLQYATKEIQEAYFAKDKANLQHMEANLQTEKIKGNEADLLKHAHDDIAGKLVSANNALLQHTKPEFQKNCAEPQKWIRYMSETVQHELIDQSLQLLPVASLKVQIDYFTKHANTQTKNAEVFNALSDAAQMSIARKNPNYAESVRVKDFLKLNRNNIADGMKFISQNNRTDIFSQLLSREQYWMLAQKQENFNKIFEDHANDSVKKLLKAQNKEEQIKAVEEDNDLIFSIDQQIQGELFIKHEQLRNNFLKFADQNVQEFVKQKLQNPTK